MVAKTVPLESTSRDRIYTKDGTNCLSVFGRPLMSPRSTPDTHFVGSEWSSWFANPVQRSIIFSPVLPMLVDAFPCLASQSLCNQLFVKKGCNLFRDPGIFCSKAWGPKTAEIWGPRTQSCESIWIHTCFWVNIGFGIYWSCALKNLVVPIYKADSPR